MSKKHKGLKIVILTIVSLLGLFYVGLALYYSHSFDYIDADGHKVEASGEKCFSYGTYINGIYATGMTVEQVEHELDKQYIVDTVAFKIDDKVYQIKLDDIAFDYDYHEPLKQYLDEQNPFLWGANLFKSANSMNVHPACVYDEEIFDRLFDKLDIKVADNTNQDVCIELTDDGYILYDGKVDVLNLDMAQTAIKDNLKIGVFSTDIDKSFYDTFDYSQEELRLKEYYELLEEKQSKKLEYHFGSEVKPVSAYDWDTLYFTEEPINKIKPNMVDKDLNVKGIDFNPDKERCEYFIKGFLDEYNTYHNRHFISHEGIEVYVDKGTYGNQIDLNKESDWFYDYLTGKITADSRIPEYILEAKYREKNDFGNTFIEVSIDEQHMWYYVNGETYIDTPITSGSLAHGGTAPRVAFVYDKIPNKWLTGPTWHSFVKYWVPIQGAIGIHDSSWRDVYGGQEYKYNGSHGCINTPLDSMKKLYEHVEIGTPVIVYSFEQNGVDNIDKKDEK